MPTKFWSLFRETTGTSEEQLAISLQDVPASQAMEYGAITPEPGAEAGWLTQPMFMSLRARSNELSWQSRPRSMGVHSMKLAASLNRGTLRIRGPGSYDLDHLAECLWFGFSLDDLVDSLTNIALATTQLGESVRFYGQICDSACRGAGPISQSRRCSQNVSRIDESRSNLT
jgi:hypothetical protein